MFEIPGDTPAVWDVQVAKQEIHHAFVPSEEGHVWRNWRN